MIFIFLYFFALMQNRQPEWEVAKKKINPAFGGTIGSARFAGQRTAPLCFLSYNSLLIPYFKIPDFIYQPLI
jgi:hypothetical protein